MRQARQNKIQSFAFVISVCMVFCFCWAFASNRVDSESAFSGRKFDLESRINPNDASVENLVRLPGLGIGRAGLIVAYRENTNRKDSDKPAFQNCNDLQKVKGIGPKTVQSISQWLKFE